MKHDKVEDVNMIWEVLDLLSITNRMIKTVLQNNVLTRNFTYKCSFWSIK